MKKIYVVYRQPSFGFGDFIRGYSFVTEHMPDVEVLWMLDHPVRKLLKNAGDVPRDVADRTYYMRNDNTPTYKCIEHLQELLRTNDEIYVMSNRYGSRLDTKCRQLFTLTAQAHKQYTKFKNDLVPNSYDVVHVRLFDDEKVSKPCYTNVVAQVRKLIEDRPTILLTNDNQFKQLARTQLTDLIIPDTVSEHLGISTGDITNTVFEMKLITGAAKCTGVTAYFHGASGFSQVPCELFGVPYSWERTDHVFKLSDVL